MSGLAESEIKFAIHGPITTDRVSATVFVEKLRQLLGALFAADRAVNGKLAHEYIIKQLHTSTPTVVLTERQRNRQSSHLFNSGIAGFRICAEAISIGEKERALSFGECAVRIQKLSAGASGKRFGYAEVWPGHEGNIIRIDEFLNLRAASLKAPDVISEASYQKKWFKGATTGTFDGVIKAVDLRGSLPELKLILSAGGKEIDCVCRIDDIAVVRSALDRRVRVSGLAIYDGRSGLPIRLQVSDIKEVGERGDFLKWKGSFAPFDPLPWEEDAE
jgi:hypothetical protein